MSGATNLIVFATASKHPVVTCQRRPGSCIPPRHIHFPLLPTCRSLSGSLHWEDRTSAYSLESRFGCLLQSALAAIRSRRPTQLGILTPQISGDPRHRTFLRYQRHPALLARETEISPPFLFSPFPPAIPQNSTTTYCMPENLSLNFHNHNLAHQMSSS